VAAGDERPTSAAPARRRVRAIHVLLYLAFLAVLIEGTGFLLARLPVTRKTLFSRGALFVERLRSREDLYRQFVVERHDGVLGWDNPRGRTGTFPGCRQGVVTATYLEDGSRRTTDLGAGPTVLTFGDSFTRGDEVEDADSYPAQLSRLRVVNHGVGGYGPVQAALKFRRRAADYPGARAAVLGITDENLFRMLTSYRPVYQWHTSGMFAFQPYMRDGVLRGNPNGPEAAPFDRFLALASQAFREDYWALPEPRFPYTWAFLDALSRPAIKLRVLAAVNPRGVLRVSEVRRGLDAVLDDFVASAGAARMAPVILLIPNKPAQRGVFDRVLPDLRARFAARAVVVSVRDEAYRWADYLPHPNCHPSVYGYGIIAAHAADAVREAESQLRLAAGP
jgi:hypothetical protein